MRFKSSDTAGAKPHLAEAELAHNAADHKLFVRVAGRPVEIKLDEVASGVIDTEGPLGAPIVRLADGGFAWDASQMPAAVSADGSVRVDRPPQTAGAPGFVPFGAQTSSVDLPAKTILLEDFAVASDAIVVTALTVFVEEGSAPLRIGFLNHANEAMIDVRLPAPTVAGPTTQKFDFTLPRGQYRAFVWAEQDARLKRVHGYRMNQGWDTAGPAGALRFCVSKSAQGEFGNGVNWHSLITEEVREHSDKAGEKRAVLMAWALPQTETPAP